MNIKHYINTIVAILLPLFATAQTDDIAIENDTIGYDAYKYDVNSPGDSITDDNNIVFDMPYSMTQNIDSMLNDWSRRALMDALNCTPSIIHPTSDSIYAERIINMPCVIEMRYNNVVKQYIQRYETKNRTLVSLMLGLSYYYFPIFEAAIEKYNLPYELKYLAIVESALNPTAKSRANAKGLWQFIFSTGKIMGLKSNNYIEERFDPIKSTDAAMRHLKELYNTFGDWSLAISAYNCGAGNVKKAILRSGGKNNFWDIYPYLPRETRGYFPTFIAATYIMTYHNEHGIRPMEPQMPITTDTLHITKNLHFKQISELCDIDIKTIRELNPQYVKDIVPGVNEPCVLHLPNETVSQFLTWGDSIYEYNKELHFPQANVAKMLKEAKSYDGSSGGRIRHKIKNGETLGGIARKYRVTVAQLKRWNNIKGTNIRAGRYLNIYK